MPHPLIVESRAGLSCDCPARVLDDALTGTACAICDGTIPPLTEVDRLILRDQRRADARARNTRNLSRPSSRPDRLALTRRPNDYAHKPRPTAFFDWWAGAGVGPGEPLRCAKKAPLAKLLAAIPPDVERVYLTGPRPHDTGSRQSWGKFQTWARGELPAGFVEPRRYLDDTALPVLSFERIAGRPLEVLRAAEWVGTGDAGPAAVRDALAAAEAAIRAAWAKGGHGEVRLLSTAGGTGRDLLARTVPFGERFEVWPDDCQELIRSTSGQGRVAVDVAPCVDELPALYGLDMRLGYGALCWGLGAGDPIHDDRPPASPQERGRYRVRFTVPAGWSHVGLLPMMADRGGWWWPAEPGYRGETWVDGAELELATREGWRCEIIERLAFSRPAGDPMRKWADALCGVALDVAGDKLARAAVRSVIVKTIGALAARPRRVTRDGEAGDQPAGVDYRATGRGDEITWTEVEPVRWPEMSHPEWSAAIWARCRRRLLSGPGGAGVLSVPRDTVVAFLTDAVYLTAPPATPWPDTGRPGQYVAGFHRAGPLPVPRTVNELYQLREV